MAKPAAIDQELEELRTRVEWIDDERRKATRRVADLEKKLGSQERELDSRERRIKQLEEKLASVTSQVSRLPQVDVQLAQFKDEIVALIEQYDERRVRSEEEMERLRRVEHEVSAREIAEIRRELPLIGRLQNEMELRQAEEARLANLIGLLQNRIPQIENRVESWSSELAYLEEAETQNSHNISDVQAQLVEISKQWEPIHSRLDILSDKLNKLQGNLDAITETQSELRQALKSWAEQIQLGEYERNQRLNKWEGMLEEHRDSMETYAQQWVTFSDQYKEARMALQNLAEWRREIEKQQRETNELARIEANRMQTRWDNYVTEQKKQWKNFEVDMEQRIATSNRHERQLREQLTTLDEQLAEVKREQEKVWRVQSAQAEAIKQIPRIWQEEVEKTLAHDPNRRRQPALVPVNEDEV